MPDERKILGRQGETAALAFLKKQGFTILETNYRCKPAEIDIIAREKNCICFIEVKTRSSLKKGLPREAVTVSKQNKIILGASFFLKGHPPSPIRFDVIEVYKNKNSFDIKLIKNAFQTPSYG